MMIRSVILFLLSIAIISVEAQPDLQKAGKQSFTFDGAASVRAKPIQVWYYSPTNRPDTLPILIMLHGAERNASGYLDQWIPVAELHQYVVVAPEFSKEDYGGAARYNSGNVWNEKIGKLNPEDTWTFSAIEPLYDYVRGLTNNGFPGYYLSGHSAGSQFVHRFLYMVPHNRAMRVAISNAGWYTFPDRKRDFPFGLNNVPVGDDNLKKLYSKEVFVVLGEADTATNSTNYNKGPEYDWQGTGRFQRGQSFYAASEQLAGSLRTPFRWKLITMPGVAHSNASTAKAIGALFKMNLR
jgi:hypothetical protein